MDPVYLFACGIVWHKTGDAAAGDELILALRDPDPDIRCLAEGLLIYAGGLSLPLLESAVDSGALDATVATHCIVQILNEGAAYVPMTDYRDRELMGSN
jgi:hypothetical protein